MTVSRYLFALLLPPTLGALFVINGLFLIAELLRVGEVTFAAGIELSDLVRICLLILPAFAVLTIPISVLVGVLLAFGRMAEDGELIALQAGGVSPFRIAVVPLLLGLTATLLASAVGLFAAPRAARLLHATFVDVAQRHVIASIRAGHFFEEIPRVVLYPRRAGDTPGQFEGFLIYASQPDEPAYALLARRAELRPSTSGEVLSLRLADGEVHAEGKDGTYSVAKFEEADLGLNIDRLVYDRTRFLPAQDRLGLDELLQGFDELKPFEQRRRLVAYHRRLASPLAAAVFALLGAALGGTGRFRGGRRTLLAAVAIVVAYYLLMRFTDVLVDQAVLGSALASWVPNLLLLGLVTRIFYKSRRAAE